MFNLCKLLLIVTLNLAAWAEDKEIDPSIGTIKKIDLSDESPSAPTHILLEFSLKKLGVAGARGHAILRQFSKSCRIDFEGSGLPRGRYTLALSQDGLSGTLSASRYQAQAKELHRFNVTSTHTSTEKTLREFALRESAEEKIVLQGKALTLFRLRTEKKAEKFEAIDCKTIAD